MCRGIHCGGGKETQIESRFLSEEVMALCLSHVNAATLRGCQELWILGVEFEIVYTLQWPNWVKNQN